MSGMMTEIKIAAELKAKCPKAALGCVEAEVTTGAAIADLTDLTVLVMTPAWQTRVQITLPTRSAAMPMQSTTKAAWWT